MVARVSCRPARCIPWCVSCPRNSAAALRSLSDPTLYVMTLMQSWLDVVASSCLGKWCSHSCGIVGCSQCVHQKCSCVYKGMDSSLWSWSAIVQAHSMRGGSPCIHRLRLMSGHLMIHGLSRTALASISASSFPARPECALMCCVRSALSPCNVQTVWCRARSRRSRWSSGWCPHWPEAACNTLVASTWMLISHPVSLCKSHSSAHANASASPVRLEFFSAPNHCGCSGSSCVVPHSQSTSLSSASCGVSEWAYMMMTAHELVVTPSCVFDDPSV